MNEWLTKLYISVTIGTWIKRILITLVLVGIWFVLDYYFHVHLPMMRHGMEVN